MTLILTFQQNSDIWHSIVNFWHWHYTESQNSNRHRYWKIILPRFAWHNYFNYIKACNIVCHLFLENIKTPEMIYNYLLDIAALKFGTINIPIKRKSVFYRRGSLFIFWHSVYTTMVTWLFVPQKCKHKQTSSYKSTLFSHERFICLG